MGKIDTSGIDLGPQDVADGEQLPLTIAQGKIEKLDKTETGWESNYWLIPVLFKDGTEKTLRANKTTMNRLLAAYGDDDSNWAGKKILVWKEPSSISKTGFAVYAKAAETK